MYKFVYVHRIKRIAYVHIYTCSTLWRPWTVEAFCNLLVDVAQSSVCCLFMLESMLMKTD